MARIRKQTHNPFSLLVKPASADCNLRCSYCFYLEKCELYSRDKTHRMKDEVLEPLIAGYLETTQPNYSFGWQGGEPTLMGLDYFKKVVSLQERYGRRGAVVSNGLQTNGVLVDGEFSEFLARYKFLVGISIDGDEELHNVYRRRGDGTGSFKDVLTAIETMNTHKVEYNALVLVSSANVDHAVRVYDFLTGLGIKYHQYIPCVEFDGEGNPLEWTISGKEWGNFLTVLFDRWYEKDRFDVSIRGFDAILHLLVNRNVVMCTLGRNCTQYFVVEHNGDVYPCDFFVQNELKLGNIKKNTWQELQNSKIYKRFGLQKSQWSGECPGCPYFNLCSGDCLKHRFVQNDEPHTLSWLCEGWKMFYAYTTARFERLKEHVLQQGGPRFERD
jgi:uncharacterized protein